MKQKSRQDFEYSLLSIQDKYNDLINGNKKNTDIYAEELTKR